MSGHMIRFDDDRSISVPTGTLLTEAARSAGVAIVQPCGGQGRCGRCAVQVESGFVRRRSSLRLSPEAIDLGFALACQAVVESDAEIRVPPQEQVERRLTTDRVLEEVSVPAGYEPGRDQTVRRVPLSLAVPSLEDQTDDWSRLLTGLRQCGYPQIEASLPRVQQTGRLLREADWQVTAVLDTASGPGPARLLDLRKGAGETPLFGAAIDIGTTTVTVWLIDLITGRVLAQASEYNAQINYGEDVISRIIYAEKSDDGLELRELVLATINRLLETACRRVSVSALDVFKVTIAGNTTMMHLFLGIPASGIRLSPYVPAVNQPPRLQARDVLLAVNPEAVVDCLPGVASYVGADISAGVLASGMDDADAVSLFIDIGTNGEIVLGCRDWLVACACSAGPAFEGAGVIDGMRATRGAIEEVWIHSETLEPTLRVIGDVRPKGICGSGLISLLAELFLTGLLDKAGGFNPAAGTARIRSGSHGLEYVVAWAAETATGRDIVLSHIDVDNLLRAKAAIYAGFNVLADTVGLPMASIERVLIGGAFGKYINVEKAVEIGLLPDMPWEQFHFLGNTAVKGAYLALLDRSVRARLAEIARRMTYIELSADNSFYEAFTSALFLPHTDLTRFPSVRPAGVPAPVLE